MIDLDRLIGLNRGTTSGPWEVINKESGTIMGQVEGSYIASPVSIKNARLIVGACNALPELIAEVKQLREENTQLHKNNKALLREKEQWNSIRNAPPGNYGLTVK